MSRTSSKAVRIATSQPFRERLQIILSKHAARCITDDNSARAAFSRKIISGNYNVQAAAYVVMSGVNIWSAVSGIPDVGADRNPTTIEAQVESVTDEAIDEALAPGGDYSKGLFHTLAVSNV